MDKDDIPSYQIDYKKDIRLSLISRRCSNRIIPIHRHSYYEIIIITDAKGNLETHEIDFVSYPLKAGYIYFIYPNQIHKWNYKRYCNQFDGYIINFNETFLLEKNNSLKQLLLKLFNPFETNNRLTFDKNKFLESFPIIDVFKNEYSKEEQNTYILKSLLETLLYYMEELKIESVKKIDTSFERLIILKNIIEENYKEERSTEFYAKKMQLSSKRLNEIIKKVSGFTITQLIHNRLILEAKRELVSQNKTIQSISYELGFENPSYFSRFFKKYEDLTPKEYLSKMLK